jgi:hypothetical protein
MRVEQITKFLSSGTPESSRRLIAYRSVMVLFSIASALTAVVCYQGMSFRPVDNGVLTALSSIVLFIAGLAREIFYRKNAVQPEDPTKEA